MGHIDEITGLLYLEGQLEEQRAAEVARHGETCAECRQLLAALENETRALEMAMREEEEPLPASLAEPATATPVPWGWAAAGLATAGTYWFWTEWIGPWVQTFGQAGFGQMELIRLLFFNGVFWEGWREMLTLIEVLAGVLLVGGTAGLLRRMRRSAITAGMMLLLLGGLMSSPPGAEAAELRKGGGTVVVKAEETVKTDLIATGESVLVEGTVEGDLIAFARTVTVKGRVTGDILGFAERIFVRGTVGGDVRAFANSVEVDGTVGKNVMTFAEHVALGSQSLVGGSLMAGAKDGSLEGSVARDVSLFAKEFRVDGAVGGDLRFDGVGLALGPRTVVKGKAKYSGPKQPDVDGAAKLASPIQVEIEEKDRGSKFATWKFYWRQALQWGAAFLFCAAPVLMVPGFWRESVRNSGRFGPSLGIGLLALVALPILALLACITLVGVALGVGALLIYPVAAYTAQGVVGTWIGSRMLGEGNTAAALLGRLAAGLVVVQALDQVPFGPFFLLYSVAVFSWGIGALALTSFRRMQGEAPA